MIELPRSLNIPENCVCYIDDIVIPVSWSTVDGRNNKLYVRMNNFSARQHSCQIITIPTKNYNGLTFAAALETAMNAAIVFGTTFKVEYDLNDNDIQITQVDNFDRYLFTLISDDDLTAGVVWDQPVPRRESIHSMNGILRLGESFSFSTAAVYNAYIDLHTVRNLYITSSSLASYNTISNFGSDVIIKKIPVRANYGQIVFDGSSNGYDFLDVSKRALNRIDFRLQDSYGNLIDLRKNHWSFSLVFQTH
jgi:transposase-like protein